MTTDQAIKHAYALQAEWVGKPAKGYGYELDRIKASIRAELRANRQYPNRCTEAGKRETRGKAILLGKVIAELKRNGA